MQGETGGGGLCVYITVLQWKSEGALVLRQLCLTQFFHKGLAIYLVLHSCLLCITPGLGVVHYMHCWIVPVWNLEGPCDQVIIRKALWIIWWKEFLGRWLLWQGDVDNRRCCWIATIKIILQQYKPGKKLTKHSHTTIIWKVRLAVLLYDFFNKSSLYFIKIYLHVISGPTDAPKLAPFSRCFPGTCKDTLPSRSTCMLLIVPWRQNFPTLAVAVDTV